MALAAGRLHTMLVIIPSVSLVCEEYPASQTFFSRVFEVSDRVGFSTAPTERAEGQGSTTRASGATCRRLNKA